MFIEWHIIMHVSVNVRARECMLYACIQAWQRIYFYMYIYIIYHIRIMGLEYVCRRCLCI